MSKPSNRILKTLAIVALFIQTNSISEKAAAESGHESNGGGVWVCIDKSNSITWAESVDLYEAEFKLGLKMSKDSKTSRKDILNSVIDKASKSAPTTYLGAEFFADLGLAISEVVEKLDIKNMSLNRIYDYKCAEKPRNHTCDGSIVYYQAINFSLRQGILVSANVWDVLSERQQAALIVHEAVYMIMRQYDFGGDVDSLRSRQITGYLMSSENYDGVVTSVELILNSSAMSLTCKP